MPGLCRAMPFAIAPIACSRTPKRRLRSCGESFWKSPNCFISVMLLGARSALPPQNPARGGVFHASARRGDNPASVGRTSAACCSAWRRGRLGNIFHADSGWHARQRPPPTEGLAAAHKPALVGVHQTPIMALYLSVYQRRTQPSAAGGAGRARAHWGARWRAR